MTAAGPHSPSPSPSPLVPRVHLGETEGTPQLGGAVSVMSNRPCRTSQEGTGRGKRRDSGRGGDGPSAGPPARTPQSPTLNVRLWQSQTSVGLGGGRPVQRPFGAGAVSGRKGSLLAAQIPAGYQPQEPSRQAPDFISISEPPLLQRRKSSRGRGNPLRLRRLLRGGHGGGGLSQKPPGAGARLRLLHGGFFPPRNPAREHPRENLRLARRD